MISSPNFGAPVSVTECVCVQTAAQSTVPLDGGVLVFQAVHDGSPMALYGVVVRRYDLLKRGHGDVAGHRGAGDGR